MEEQYPNLATIEQIVAFVLVNGHDALYTEEGRPFIEAWRGMRDEGRPMHEYTGRVLTRLGYEGQEKILDTVTPALTKCLAKVVKDQLDEGDAEGANTLLDAIPWLAVKVIRAGFWLGYAVGLQIGHTHAYSSEGLMGLMLLEDLEVP